MDPVLSLIKCYIKRRIFFVTAPSAFYTSSFQNLLLLDSGNHIFVSKYFQVSDTEGLIKFRTRQLAVAQVLAWPATPSAANKYNCSTTAVVTVLYFRIGARCSSVVRAFAHGAMGRRIDPSWGGPIELFLVPASAPRLV